MSQSGSSADAALPVFHITHWKAGSEWVRAVLNALGGSRFVPRQAGPGHPHLTDAPLRPDGIYSPMYLHRAAFDDIVRVPHRRFVVIRDLRDTLISWYFSLRYSHPARDNPRSSVGLGDVRAELAGLSQEDGILRVLADKLPDAAKIQRSWLTGTTRDHSGMNDFIVRYENLWADPHAGFTGICAHIGLAVSPGRLTQVLERKSFERRSGRRAGQADVQSHFRQGLPGDWRNHFTPRITREFKARFGSTLILAGDEASEDW